MERSLRIPWRLWCAWLLVLFVVGGALGFAQAPGSPELEALTTAAEHGDASAQMKLGMRYYNSGGRRADTDYAEAMKWFRMAADQGNTDAQDRVGMMYHFGYGVPKDNTQAAHWYQLAAEGGNAHAQLQLVDMYQRGVGVPRDHQESKKWLALYNAHHPDHSTLYAQLGFLAALLALLAFGLGLAALQRNLLTGFPRVVVAILVNTAGIALVLNSLATYGFWVVFPHCSHDFLATACTQISDPSTRKIVNQIGDWAMTNLIFRFMAMVGFLLDILAGWYLVYLAWSLFRRAPRSNRLQPLKNQPVA